MTDKEIRLTNLYYKIDRGLVQQGSDLHFAISMIRELNDEIKSLYIERTNGRAGETVRKDGSRRSKKTRVRKRSNIRTERSNSKAKPMEGG